MRGPGTTPRSIAIFTPKAGPPTSRTVVNPRWSVAPASRPAIRCTNPISCVSAACWLTATSVACQCASISPGITAPPRQSIRSASCGPCADRQEAGDPIPLHQDLDPFPHREGLAIEEAEVRQKQRPARRLGADLARREAEARKQADHRGGAAQHLPTREVGLDPAKGRLGCGRTAMAHVELTEQALAVRGAGKTHGGVPFRLLHPARRADAFRMGCAWTVHALCMPAKRIAARTAEEIGKALPSKDLPDPLHAGAGPQSARPSQAGARPTGPHNRRVPHSCRSG